MASESKKAKTDKKNHPGRDRHWLKGEKHLKRIGFYTKSERHHLNSEIGK